ncbi:phosphonate ABC transporter ATP-binding protein [Rhodovulum sp. DZ06]|uniref:phosphonate ABC transporter ATP-binding protein n=1 Tax=Rhodovulum sp. DZ06 TaxID=3425126 RepID=UPI003D344B67
MLIKINALTKRFGDAVAVDRATILVDRPQMIGVIGRSGAGKSTLLRMINRLTEASEGEIVVGGEDIRALRGADLRRWRRDCAMIFQQFNLVPRLDVVTNVMLGRVNDHGALRSLFNVFPDQDIRDAITTLERLGIAEHALKRAEALSGGQQQRVAIARALMQRPKLVLADEPIASLDPLNATRVMDALRAIHEEDGLTVMCNLHTLDTARRYCDRIIGMRDGRIVFDGTAEQLTEGAARDIYGAGAEFSEAATSTSIDALAAQASLAARQVQAGATA